MSEQPTPDPASTWHVPVDSMYPAIMDRLAQLSDQVRALVPEVKALRADVASLRVEQRALRWGVLGFVAIFILSVAGFGVAALLR